MYIPQYEFPGRERRWEAAQGEAGLHKTWCAAGLTGENQLNCKYLHYLRVCLESNVLLLSYTRSWQPHAKYLKRIFVSDLTVTFKVRSPCTGSCRNEKSCLYVQYILRPAVMCRLASIFLFFFPSYRVQVLLTSHNSYVPLTRALNGVTANVIRQKP